MVSDAIESQQIRIRDQYQRPHADAERLAVKAVPPQRFPAVMGQDDDESDREVQEVAMDVLENERKAALSPIGLARLADSAIGRIGPEGLVIRAAIIVAS